MSGRKEDYDLDAVADILGDADQFIEGIYRDFSIEPTPKPTVPVKSNSNINLNEPDDRSSQPSSSTNLTPRKPQANRKETPVTYDLDSVDDLLENVDQFIEGVYRDMTIQAKPRKSFNINPRPLKAAAPTLLPVTSSLGAVTSALPTSSNVRGLERSTVSSIRYPTSTVVNCTCKHADHQRYNGSSMNNSPGTKNKATSVEKRSYLGTTRSPASSTNLTRPAIPTFAQQSSRRLVGGGSGNGGETRQRPPVAPSQYIDLSESDTQSSDEVRQTPQHDEDVLLVEANINPVINMCQPGPRVPPPIRRQTANEMSVQFSRRRMTEPAEDVISVVLGPGAAQRRRIEIRFNWHPIQTLAPTNTTQTNTIPQTNTILQTNTIPQTSTVTQSNNTAPQINPTPQAYSTIQTNPTTQSNTVQSNTATQATNNTVPLTNSQDPPFMCAVCMESSLQRQPTSTRCGHIFCNECITHAIRLTHKCPLCNTKITAGQIFRIYL